LRGDAFAWTLVAEHPEFGLLVGSTRGIEGAELRNYSMAQIVDTIAEPCHTFKIQRVFGDQREAASLESMFSERGLCFTSFAWSEVSKAIGFQTLRRLMRERRIHFEQHKTLQAEMLSCKAHLRPSGRVSYSTNGLDYLSCVVTLMHAVNESLVNPNSASSYAPIEQPAPDADYAAFECLSNFASL
jgi:hypothetical protein